MKLGLGERRLSLGDGTAFGDETAFGD